MELKKPFPVHYNYIGCRPHIDEGYVNVGVASGVKPNIVRAEFSASAQTCTVALEEDRERQQFQTDPDPPKPYVLTLEKGQDSVLFPVPRPHNAPIDSAGLRGVGRKIRCSIDRTKVGDEYVVGQGALTQVVSVSEHPASVMTDLTFDNKVQQVLFGDTGKGHKIARDLQVRVHQIGSALFYLYIWGWYTGFVEMPLYSIQGLLASPPLSVGGGSSAETADIAQNNTEMLQRYSLLNSLFVDESNPQFESRNFEFFDTSRSA